MTPRSSTEHDGRDAGAGTTTPILVPGRNCWRQESAARVAFLVDGDAYFDAFAAAVARAERSILVLSWDIDSRMPLRHDGDPALPDRLGSFLNTVVSRRPGLHAHVLNWDFAMIYALEREPLPLVKLGWRTHRRLHFRLDGRHPVGACHHQKVVVIDDAIAFAGGLDLCTHRWDTRAHPAVDPCRVDAVGRPYGPFHDVQMAVDGAAAAALGELVRTRWFRATGRRIAAPPLPLGDPWPPGLVPDVTDVEVAIARTEPEFAGRAEVHEVKTLYLDAIRSAERFLYIENQYFTSAAIADALVARLQARDGPEIVLVLPLHSSGWLEENTMGTLRAGIIRRLRAADRHDRLRIYCPVVPGLAEGCLNVHAKVMVVDDRLVRVGSANLSNRSMGFDTECDLAIEAAGEACIGRAIADFRNGLIAEHLDVSPARVAEVLAVRGSLVAAVDELRGGERTLVPLDPAESSPGPLLAAASLADPERPVDAERLLDQLVPEEVRDGGYRPFLRGGATIVGVALALASSSAVSHHAIVATTMAWTAPLRATAFAPALVVAAYVVGGLAFVPVTALTLATILVFDLSKGVVYAVAGTLASAATGYIAGRALGRDVVRRVAGPRLNGLTRRLMRRGPLAMAGARFAALVPFTPMNLVAGASRLPLRDYAVGTLIGTVPGVLAIGLLAHWFRVALRTWGVRAAALATVVGVLLWFAGRAARLRRRPVPAPAS